MRSYFGLVVMFILTCIPTSCIAGTFNDSVALLQYIENQSHKSVRPQVDQTRPLTVNVSAFLREIFSLDEKNQRLTASITLGMAWYGDTMMWDTEDYGGTSKASLNPNTVWVPDIGVLNSAGANLEPVISSSMMVSVQFDGRNSGFTGIYTETKCGILIAKYPFDQQQCEIIVGIMNDDEDLLLKFTNGAASLSSFDDNDSWEVTAAETFERTENRRSRLVIRLTLKRRYMYFVFSLIIPLFTVSFMNVLSFKIPALSGERISYGVSLFLTFIMLLNVFSESMPSVSSSLSILQLYINAQMTCSLATTAFSIVLVRLARSESVAEIPHVVMWMYNVTNRDGPKRNKEALRDVIHKGGTIGNCACVDEKTVIPMQNKDESIQNRGSQGSDNAGLDEDRNNGGHSLVTVEDITCFIDAVGFVLSVCVYVTLSSVCLVAMMT